MRAVAAFIDPGYRAGLTVLWDDGRLDLYQIECGEGWPGRVKLGAHVRNILPLFGREGIGLGVVEIGTHVHGHSRQSSVGLGINAGAWLALPVKHWEQLDPMWQKVKGWELEVEQVLARANVPDRDVLFHGDCALDAFDSIGLMCHWVRRSSMLRATWARDVQAAFRKIDSGRLTILLP